MIRPAALAVLRSVLYPACHLEMDRKRDTEKIALDKGEFDDNISYFSWKPYVVTPHLNRLVETVQMRGHNISFYSELTKIIRNYHQILPLIYSSVANTDISKYLYIGYISYLS